MKPEKAIYNAESLPDTTFGSMVKRRRNEAEEHWNKTQSLKEVRSRNNKDYLAKYIEDTLVDDRYQEVYVDNRQFTSVRTIVPFLTARITAPEVTPAKGTDLAIQFAHDFEEVLQRHLSRQQGRSKVRLIAQDLLRGERVGVGKWRYDAARKTVIFERCKPNSILIGKRSSLFEEPDFVGHTIERTVGELLQQFPDKEKKILELFGIEKGVPSQLEKQYDINEDWIWVHVDGKKELLVGWSWQNFVFGKIKDPNWDEKGNNVIDEQMMPFVFLNFLNNGDGYIDDTSFMEQARWLQSNYNKRGQTIAENAKYGGTGVPIFAKGAITQKDVAKIRFSPIQRVLLDTNDVTKAFTTWQSQNLTQYIVEDKYDDRNSIDNIWGTPNIFRGEQSKNNTLGQDVMVRDQAEGRLGDPVDCIDDMMTRSYKIEAQLIYRYFDEAAYYNYIGSDGKFVSIVVDQKQIADNLGIQIDVKAGTSLPIDRAQKRATIMKLVERNRIGTLTAYKELGIFEDPEAAYKEFLLEQADPKASLEEVDKQVFDREANEDLQIVIGGKDPEEREDISEEYVQYLINWLETDKYKLLEEEDPEASARVSQFIDAIVAKMQRKADKIAMQPAPAGEEPPVPPEMQAAAEAQGQPPMTPPNAPPPISGNMPTPPPVVQ